jgi:hypothetical protein
VQRVAIFRFRFTRWLLLTAAALTCLTVQTGLASPKSKVPQNVAGHDAMKNHFRDSRHASAVIKVCARPYWNHSGFIVEGGATYELSASGTWYDASIPSGPDGYSHGNFLQDLVSGLRRSPRNRWFALMGSLDGASETIFLIGSHATYTPARSGEVVCFANDVPGFYWNNKGSITLTIDRIK